MGVYHSFEKNETATMFFLEKPSLVGSCCVEVDLSDSCVVGYYGVVADLWDSCVSYCGWLL